MWRKPRMQPRFFSRRIGRLKRARWSRFHCPGTRISAGLTTRTSAIEHQTGLPFWIWGREVLSLLVILLVVGVAVLVLLWAGSLFLQSYYYTEPTEQLYWKAPAAAGALFVFWLVWCLINANSA